jgi:2-hydroxycyclohexanecarboxyl-CoA dehydrogenase
MNRYGHHIRGTGRGRRRSRQRHWPAGAQVCWLDLSDSVKTESKGTPDSAPTPLPYQVDATDYSRLQQIASQIQDQTAQIDHVVVSVGLATGTLGFPFWNLAPEQWNRVVQVNLMGAVNVAHAFVPYMLPRRRGTFCFVSSIAGQIGSQTDPPYSAAKAGLINFVQCAAKDLAPYQIRANAISPGMVKTPMNQQVWEAWIRSSPDHTLTYDEWAEQKIKQVTPLGRWQTPEDMAAMMLFLASDKAANITGQTLNVDGGQVMHA